MELPPETSRFVAMGTYERPFNAYDLINTFKKLKQPEFQIDEKTGEDIIDPTTGQPLPLPFQGYVNDKKEDGTVYYSRCADAISNNWTDFFNPEEFEEHEKQGGPTTLTSSLNQVAHSIPADPVAVVRAVMEDLGQAPEDIASIQLTNLAKAPSDVTAASKKSKKTKEKQPSEKETRGRKKKKATTKEIPEELGGEGQGIPQITDEELSNILGAEEGEEGGGLSTPSRTTPSPGRKTPASSPGGGLFGEPGKEGETMTTPSRRKTPPSKSRTPPTTNIPTGQPTSVIPPSTTRSGLTLNIGIPSPSPLRGGQGESEEEGVQPPAPEAPERELSPEERQQVTGALNDLQDIVEEFDKRPPEVRERAQEVVKGRLNKELLSGRITPAEYVVLTAKDKEKRRKQAEEYRKNRLVNATKQQWDAMKKEVRETIDITVADEMNDMVNTAVSQNMVRPGKEQDFMLLVAETESSISNGVYRDLAWLITEPSNITPQIKGPRKPGEAYDIATRNEGSPIVDVPPVDPSTQNPVDPASITENIDNSLDQFLDSPAVENAELPPGAVNSQWVHPRGFAGTNWEVARYQSANNDNLPPDAWPADTVSQLFNFITAPQNRTPQALNDFTQNGELVDIYNKITGRYANKVEESALNEGFSNGVAASLDAGCIPNAEIPPQDFLRAMMCGITAAAGISILIVGENEPFQNWLSTESAKKLLNGELEETAYVLCGALKKEDDGLSIQLVISQDLAINLLNPETAQEEGRTTYIAVDNTTNQLVGFLMTKDYRRAPETWKNNPKKKPLYFRLSVNKEAVVNQGMPDFPQFYGQPGSGEDPTDDAIEGVNTKEFNSNGTPNKLLNSLEMEFLCAKSQAYIGDEETGVDVNILGRFNRDGSDYYRVITSRGEEVIVPVEEVSFYPGSKQNVAFMLMLNALIDNVDQGYWGSLIFVVNVFSDPSILFKGGNINQGAKDIETNAVGYADSDVAAKYHTWFQYERAFGTEDMSTSLGLIWFYDKGNVYKYNKSKTKGAVYGRRAPISLYPDHRIMYRPYPTLSDLASYVAQAAGMVIPSEESESMSVE